MTEIIENETLLIEIENRGAELKRIYHKQKEKEYLWPGSREWWPRSAPVLFPIVGKLNDNHYRVNGGTYSLSQHGFARDKDFLVHQKNQSVIHYRLEEDEESLKIYPFLFTLEIGYALQGPRLEVSYKVINKGKGSMYFSIGGHPGFICPLEEKENFSDYYLQFEKKETIDRYLVEEGLLSGKTERILTDENILPLHYDLFEHDAIVLKNMASTFMLLKSRVSDYSLRFDYGGYPFFGIWTQVGAPFICLEPWCGIADTKGFDGAFPQKEGVEKLKEGEAFHRAFAITL